MLLNALSKHSFLWNLSQATITDTKRHVEQMLYVLVRYRIQVFCTNQTPINLAFYTEFITIYKNSYNEIIMDLKNIRQIFKDRTHRSLIVGLIFEKESTTLKYWFKSVYCIFDRIALLFNDFQVLLSNAFIYS